MQPAEFGSCRLASCQVDPQTRNQLSDKVGQQQPTITLSPRLWTGQHCLPFSFPPHNSQVPPAFMRLQERETCRRANYCKQHLNHLLGTYVTMLQGTFCHTHDTFEQLQIPHLTSPAGSDHHQIYGLRALLCVLGEGRLTWGCNCSLQIKSRWVSGDSVGWQVGSLYFNNKCICFKCTSQVSHHVILQQGWAWMCGHFLHGVN